MRHRALGIVIVLITLLALVVGCSSAPAASPTSQSAKTTTTSESAKPTAESQAAIATVMAQVGEKPSATLEEGWTRVEKLTEGYALAMPPKWGHIDLDPAKTDATIKDVVNKNSNMSITNLAEQAKSLRDQGINIFALDLSENSGDSGFVTNINVIVRNLSDTLTLDEMTAAVAEEAQTQAGKGNEVKQRTLSTAAGDAVEVKYAMTTKANGKDLKVTLYQYAYIKDKSAYLITCSTDKPDTFGPLFEKVGKYFRTTDASATAPSAAKPTTPAAKPTAAPKATATPVSGLPAGWKLVQDKVNGFAIGQAPNWKQIDMSKANVQASVAAAIKDNPKLKPFIEEQAGNLSNGGIFYCAFDFSPEGAKGTIANGFAANINVEAVALKQAMTLEDYSAAYLDKLKNDSTITSDIRQEMLKLGDLDCWGVNYEFDSEMLGKPISINTIQIYIMKGKSVYIINLVTPSAMASDYSSTLGDVAESFRFLD